ncbi:MAG: hypothetical protein AUG49_11985 [Catenulispora sp. 13_1_20CM_3_70_7]|jgi:deazaflavin-dependent oxidoreductase (nitroreductase family)|nr:nitroreductase family deazaflavin-dependent oxidoreductase [Catenulisporales bacterium]OLE25009.1 MAG: hypothetical protein AUG49_11985 [Catenulispora sp. 13_1_20CM_3_70_7]
MGTETKPDGRPAGRAQTLRMQGLVNVLMRTALSTPGMAKGIGRRMILLYVVGRNTGKRYAIPVAYMEYEGKVLLGTQFPWVRNLRTGERIEVRYKRKVRTAEVEVVEEEDRVVELFEIMCRDNHAFAKFHNIDVDGKGEPDPAAVREAYRLGARAILLTPTR